MFCKRKVLLEVIGVFVFLAMTAMPRLANAAYKFSFSIAIHSKWKQDLGPFGSVTIKDKIVIKESFPKKEGGSKQNMAIVAIHVPNTWAMTHGDTVGPSAYYDQEFGAPSGWGNATLLEYSKDWSDTLEADSSEANMKWYAFVDTAGGLLDLSVGDSMEVRWTVYEGAGSCNPDTALLDFACGTTDDGFQSFATNEYDDCQGVSSVDISSLSANGHDGYVEVNWTTASELDNAGFNLYRSLSKDGEKSQLNEALIPAQGDELQGASYSFTDNDVTPGITYYYWLEDVDIHGKSTMHGPVTATPTVVEGKEEKPIPTGYGLAQNYPNPFNATTGISYQLAGGNPHRTTLKIYNIQGQEVATLVDEVQAPGYYSVAWDGRDDLGKEVSSGIYFYRLQAGSYAEIKKMVLLK